MYAIVSKIKHNPSTAVIERCERNIVRTTNDLNYQRDYHRQLKMQLRVAERKLAALQNANPTAWDFIKIAPVKEVSDKLVSVVKTQTARAAENFISRRNEVDSQQRLVANAMDDLQRLRFSLRHAQQTKKADTVYKASDWEHELRLNDVFHQGSLKIKQQPTRYGTDYKICVRFKSTIADTQTVQWDEACSPFPSIKIPSIYVDFSFKSYDSDAQVTMRAVAGSERYPGYRGLDLLHPHMTSPTYPCLGDFAGPIYEALHDFDIPTAVVVMGMFLQQYDPQDSAGAYYHNWPEVQQHVEAA